MKDSISYKIKIEDQDEIQTITAQNFELDMYWLLEKFQLRNTSQKNKNQIFLLISIIPEGLEISNYTLFDSIEIAFKDEKNMWQKFIPLESIQVPINKTIYFEIFTHKIMIFDIIKDNSKEEKNESQKSQINSNEIEKQNEKNDCFDYFNLSKDKKENNETNIIKNTQEITKIDISSPIIINNKKRKMIFDDSEERKNDIEKEKDNSTIKNFKRLKKNSISISSQKNNEEKKLEINHFEERKDRDLRRLKKIVDLEKNVCAICLSELEDEKGMLSCKHVFCFNCIKDWSQVTNLCPLCKSEFLDIRKKIGFSNEILETIKVERKKLKIEENLEEIEDDSDQFCYVCENDHDAYLLLLCDKCNYFCCHTYCLDPPLDTIPEEEWICYYCENESYNFNNSHIHNRNQSYSRNTRNTRNTRNRRRVTENQRRYRRTNNYTVLRRNNRDNSNSSHYSSSVEWNFDNNSNQFEQKNKRNIKKKDKIDNNNNEGNKNNKRKDIKKENFL